MFGNKLVFGNLSKVQKAIRWFRVLRSFSRKRRGERVFSVIVPPFCLAVP